LADYENDLMFCARDIAGEKPLYYSQQCDHFIIASEIKAILAYSGLTEIHLTDDFRAFEYMTGAETLFEGIMSVLPGEQLLIRRMSSSRDDLERKNYWNINDEIIEIPGDRVVDYLDELLHDAVRLRLRSDVPMGLYLSGGIDSSLLAYFIKPDVAFSVSFPYGPKYDEIEYARMVAKEIGCEHYVLSPTSCDFKHTLDDVLYHLDMPVGSFSAFPLYILAKKASEHVKVIFSGEGADELFSGYTRYLLPYWDEQAYQVPQLENYHPLLDYYYGQALDRFAKLLNRGLVNDEKMKAIIFPFFSQFDDIRHAMGFTEFKLMLVTLLHMEDRMSAAFGIENRSPFLDKRIISFAYSIPGDWKIKGTETKRIVRELASRYIPKAILERKEKLGLIAPINLWMGFSGVRGEFDRTTYNRLCFEHWKHVFFVEKRHTKPSPSVKPVEVY
jgi:asparagine synthase (glutamine-hydrolysing)